MLYVHKQRADPRQAAFKGRSFMLQNNTAVLTWIVMLHIRSREWVFQRFSSCLLWLFASVTSIYFYGAVRNAFLCVFVNVSMHVQGGVCMEYVFMHTSVHENVLRMGQLVLTKFQSHFQGPRTSIIRTGSLEMTPVYFQMYYMFLAFICERYLHYSSEI